MQAGSVRGRVGGGDKGEAEAQGEHRLNLEGRCGFSSDSARGGSEQGVTELTLWLLCWRTPSGKGAQEAIYNNRHEKMGT